MDFVTGLVPDLYQPYLPESLAYLTLIWTGVGVLTALQLVWIFRLILLVWDSQKYQR